MCKITHCIKITQGSLSRSIWKNSPHLKIFTLTPEVASATNIRYVSMVFVFINWDDAFDNLDDFDAG